MFAVVSSSREEKKETKKKVEIVFEFEGFLSEKRKHCRCEALPCRVYTFIAVMQLAIRPQGT
jgi:hypothetical protein